MRVHPSSLTPKLSKWQFPAALAVMFVLLLLNLIARPSKQPPPKPAAPIEKKIDVVVAKDPIEAGQPLDKANLAIEQRAVSTLPSDVITTFDAIKNKVALGPIPAKYPLSKAFLADPVAVSTSGESGDIDDPIEALLTEIERETVAIPVTFAAESPPRGARLAITLQKGRGESLLLIEDCWVSKAAAKEAVLRLDPSQALILQSARSYGNFGFIVLPTEGESPYTGKGVASEEELKLLIEGPPQAVSAKERATKDKHDSPDGLVGKAWVTGDETSKIGIYKDGSMKKLFE